MADFEPLWKIGTRRRAMDILIAARKPIDSLIEGLSDTQLKRRALLGGGEWSVKDLLGHLAGYEEEAIVIATGKKARFDYGAFGSVDERNAADLERKLNWPVMVIKDEFTTMRSQLLDTIQRMDDERWNSKIRVAKGKSALALVLGRKLSGGSFGLFAHDLAHKGDLEKSVKML